MNKSLIIILLLLNLFACSQTNNNGKLIIYRQESNGRMNIIPCRIYVKSVNIPEYYAQSIEVYNYEDKVDKKLVKDNIAFLVGGEKVVYLLNPGKYKISILTPISEQGKYIEENEHDWISIKYELQIEEGKTIERYIAPITMDSTYAGGWELLSNPIGE